MQQTSEDGSSVSKRFKHGCTNNYYCNSSSELFDECNSTSWECKVRCCSDSLCNEGSNISRDVNQPRSQGLFPGLGAGPLPQAREKSLGTRLDVNLWYLPGLQCLKFFIGVVLPLWVVLNFWHFGVANQDRCNHARPCLSPWQRHVYIVIKTFHAASLTKHCLFFFKDFPLITSLTLFFREQRGWTNGPNWDFNCHHCLHIFWCRIYFNCDVFRGRLLVLQEVQSQADGKVPLIVEFYHNMGQTRARIELNVRTKHEATSGLDFFLPDVPRIFFNATDYHSSIRKSPVSGFLSTQNKAEKPTLSRYVIVMISFNQLKSTN